MSDDEGNSDGDHTLNGNSGSDNICRDYLRNVCRRGSSCKFKHPEGNEADQLGKKMEYVFCHDFQNRECHRINCKFMHCTRQEEQQYRATGELPKHCLDSMNGSKVMSPDGGSSGKNNDPPVCKDYLKGDCRRGSRCKFRHINNNEYEMEMGNGRGRRDRFDRFDRFDNFEFEPEAKRRAFDEPYHPSIMDRGGMGLGSGGSLGGHGMGMPPPFHNFRMLEDENILLRRKVEELKKQIADLTATNEFLLDQNAQLRLTKSSVSHSMASMSQMPMNNSDLSAPVSLGQGMSASMANMGQGLPSVSLAQSMMTMSTPSTNLVSYPIMTQSMRPIIPHGMGH